MKILHTADVHYPPLGDGKDAALKSLEVFRKTGEKENVDLFVIAGDLFDRAVPNTGKAGLPELYNMITSLLNIAPIVVVEGTPTHDIPGCYDIFRNIKARHSLTILKPGKEYWLKRGFDVAEGSGKQPIPISQSMDLLILGCPEPSKNWLLANRKALGPKESQQAMVDEMRKLLLGLGAIRKSFPKIPCLFVYHGSVSGASMCNGQILSNNTEIGRDDLALVGADYYALGHIHLAQEIGTLPAYYPGSAYPVNWGELDQKGFNLVTLKADKEARIKRISYPHPPRKKITIDFSNTNDLLDNYDLKGYQVWIEVKIKKADAESGFDPKILEKLILEDGAMPGSKVTLSIIPTETVRAQGITKVKRHKDKVKIYAENSNQDVSETILEKADQLETEAKQVGLNPEGLHIRIKKLILRGAIGIWKGQRKNEVEIDLDKYEPGLVEKIKKNGAGKTTLIENMHPYPSMLTRSGSLQSHFRLRDSFRDLYFVDEKTGVEYRALAMIDGANQTGKAEYNLFRKNGSGFEPMTNGRREDYEVKLNRLFGSLPLFLRSAFITQKPTKNNPDIADATAGEKKSLLRELGGLGYLQNYSDMAKEKEKTLDRETLQLRGKIENMTSAVAVLPSKIDEKDILLGKLDTQEKLLRQAEADGKKIAQEYEDISKKLNENNELKTKISEIEKQIENIKKEKSILATEIVELQNSVENREGAEQAIKEWEKLKEQEAKLNEKKIRIMQSNQKLLNQYTRERDIVANTEKEYLAEKNQKKQEIAKLETEKARFVTQIDVFEEKLSKPLEKNCPTCGQVLPEQTLIELKTAREVVTDQLKNYQKKVFEIDKEIVLLKEEVKTLEENIDRLEYPGKPVLTKFDQGELDDIVSKIQGIRIDEMRNVLEQAKTAEVKIEGLQKQIDNLEKQKYDLTDWKNEKEKFLDPEIEYKYIHVKEKLKQAREEYQSINQEVAGLKAEISALEKQIEELQKATDELLQHKKELSAKLKDMTEWAYLKKACGPNGIQALELDAMGPGIAEIANRLLSAAYGSRFRIEFKTTRISGSGSKTKQIEDFRIMITDSEDNTEQELDTMSGGEAVWIKRAIYDAFGIIRDRDTGVKFLTAFQDEADGALDAENRVQYFKMLEAAHQESGRRHTILITHSPEAQQMIEQKIDISELQEAEKKETGAVA